MKIGELAAASGTPVDTIRFYEREGLLPAPARSGGNYRVYESMHLARLQFIRHCRLLDLSLDEVRELLAVRDARGPDAHAADRVLDAHIAHVSRRIRELRALERQLKELRALCGGRAPGQPCAVLDGLAAAPPARGHAGAVHKSVR